ncbi:MAG: GntR family transcriptional regulator, partial [Synergistaceae bacterium]|nr:GntR family transcriptional regulator [Synergistaceae bacterium]
MMLKMAKNDSKIIALDYLKEQIITCEMPPGSVIRVDDVAEKLCISKTPVREALIELKTDCYVNIVPRKKTIVSK